MQCALNINEQETLTHVKYHAVLIIIRVITYMVIVHQ